MLKLCEVSRDFGHTQAVSRLTLEVQEGEIFALLGPSGCGKSTTLRLVVGLERPDEGEIYLREQPVASVPRRIFVPAHKRRMGMVFQSYAIWPHLTVFENVAYPLQAMGIRRMAVQERVQRALQLVGLEGFDNRPAPHLSGGQQQRVALARALVYEPQILLLDEPFSSLDAKLREQMRVELKQLQRRVGITALFVTHDQQEALSLSDRIAVMNSGQVMQVGTPQKLYEKPANAFVRDFLGKSIVLQGEITRIGPGLQLEVLLAGGQPRSLIVQNVHLSASIGQPVSVAIRPEDVVLEPDATVNTRNRLEGKIAACLFAGDRYECQIEVGTVSISVYLPRLNAYQEGQIVPLFLPPQCLSAWKA